MNAERLGSPALPAALPLVSVIVPSYNQGAFLRDTLESILRQDYRPLEVLVIDGASTDDTLDVLREYDGVPEVRWISEPDSGVVEAVNKGFARARGEIGAIQSSDDYYIPGAVRAGVEALLADASLALVYGDIIKVDERGTPLSGETLAPFSLEAVLACRTWIPQPSTFFRMESARAAGGWREGVPYAADTDLWLRMLTRAGGRKIDQVLAARRVHEAQRDRHGDRILRDYDRMITDLLGDGPNSSRLRRAAGAGRLLQRNRYGSGGYWRRLGRQWGALLLHPPLRDSLPLSSLIPGWNPLRKALSRMRGATSQAVLEP